MRKRLLHYLIRRLAASESIRDQLRRCVSEFEPRPIAVPFGFSAHDQLRRRNTVDHSNSPIFISSRFRSGSTLLWRCFRECHDTSAYYEPLNPRRWFDPEHRGSRVDTTHRQVIDYWSEYSHLEDANVPWDDHWSSSDLFLPPSVPALTLWRYIDLLITTSPHRPLLQFNRIDFRLHWLRRRYPDAFMIHLHRNPRDQWISTFLKGSPVGKDVTMHQFQLHDEFYLTSWVKDLRRYFPVFSEIDQMHPYEASYLLWRLSGIYARAFCDHCISYDDFVNQPKDTLGELGEKLNISDLERGEPVSSIDAHSTGRWRQYDDGAWFRERERFVDQLLEHCMELPPTGIWIRS